VTVQVAADSQDADTVSSIVDIEPDLEPVNAAEQPAEAPPPAPPSTIFPQAVAVGRIIIPPHHPLAARLWSDRDDVAMPIIAASNNHCVFVNIKDVSSLIE
jgi:hypothetical protein